MIGIYLYTNKINGKQYVGQSVDIEARHKRHLSDSKWDKPRQVIDRAIKKYGINNFDFDILVECVKEDLNIQEEYWVKYWDTYKTDNYNMIVGGGSLGAGKDNPAYSDKKYDFKHENGNTEYCTQYTLRTKYELSCSHLSMVCTGKIKSVKGWGIGNWFKLYHFKHDDGTELHCTRNQLRTKYNISVDAVFAICSGKSKKRNGLSLNHLKIK